MDWQLDWESGLRKHVSGSLGLGQHVSGGLGLGNMSLGNMSLGLGKHVSLQGGGGLCWVGEGGFVELCLRW